MANSNWNTKATITALYGQDISGYFPIHANNGVAYDQGERWKATTTNVYKEVLVIVNQMPDADVTFRLNTSDNGPMTLNYYVEALSNDDETNTVNCEINSFLLGITSIWHFYIIANNQIRTHTCYIP